MYIGSESVGIDSSNSGNGVGGMSSGIGLKEFCRAAKKRLEE